MILDHSIVLHRSLGARSGIGRSFSLGTEEYFVVYSGQSLPGPTLEIRRIMQRGHEHAFIWLNDSRKNIDRSRKRSAWLWFAVCSQDTSFALSKLAVAACKACSGVSASD